MNRTVKISAIILLAGVAAGCATNSDIEDLQKQITGLKSQVSTASTDAARANASADAAQTAASEAAARAAAAEAAANRAADYAQETNSKLDRMFKQSMMK